MTHQVDQVASQVFEDSEAFLPPGPDHVPHGPVAVEQPAGINAAHIGGIETRLQRGHLGLEPVVVPGVPNRALLAGQAFHPAGCLVAGKQQGFLDQYVLASGKKVFQEGKLLRVRNGEDRRVIPVGGALGGIGELRGRMDGVHGPDAPAPQNGPGLGADVSQARQEVSQP